MHRYHDLAHVNGTRLYYEMAGSGDPLVLIHGHTLDTRMWDDQFEPFARHYRVIRYDMRGYGKSALPTAESYAPADDLMALLRHLGLRSAHILGQSRGGAVAIDFALTYPEATATLIAVDAVLRGFPWTGFGKSLSEIHSAGRTSGVEAARQRWLDDALFAASLENLRVAPRLKQMVGDYSGWAWINDEPLRPLEPPSIQQIHRINIPHSLLLASAMCRISSRSPTPCISAFPMLPRSLWRVLGICQTWKIQSSSTKSCAGFWPVSEVR